MAKQKNIVGDLHNVHYARIGDEVHIHLAEPSFPKELTLNIPRTHPNDIIGREADLEQLYTSLHAEKRVVVVNGLGGIGKTTLAQAYVSRYYEEYQHIVWITQDSEDVARDFVNAAGLILNLGLEVMVARTGAGAGTQPLFEEIIRKLKTISDHPNLLVIDNGERSLRRYKDLLPGQPRWHVLVTSREVITGYHRQPLGFLEEGQAVALFIKHYPLQAIGDAGIRKLVRAVDYHTLTIEMLAKMAAMQRYDLRTLQLAIEKDLKAGIEVGHDRRRAGAVEKIGSYLRTTFTLSRLSEEEVWLLKQFVCLPPEPHPYRLLRELLVDEQGEHARSFAEVLGSLSDRGWLLYNPAGDSYSMHRIIAGVVRKERVIQLEEVAYLLGALTDRLHADYTVDNTLDKFAWVPYGKALLAVFSRSGHPGIAKLQNRLGFVLLRLDDLSYARSILEKAVRSDTKNFGKDHPTTTMHLNNLALVLMDQGDLSGAKKLLERAVRNDEKNLGPGHHHTAIRYHNLAMLLRDMEDLSGARPLMEKVVRIETKNFGFAHPATTRAHAHLALIMEDLGDLRVARALLKKAVRGDEQYYGMGHPAIMELYHNLARLLQDQGKCAEAKGLMEKAIRASEKVFGVQHPHTAELYNRLGLVLRDMKDYAAARSLLEKAIRIYKESWGAGHFQTATTISNLGLVLSDMGDYSGALVLQKKAIRVLEKTLGPDDPVTILTYADLADVLFELKDYRAASAAQEKAVRGSERTFGKQHIETANAYYNLALILLDLDQFRRAAALVKKAMPVFRKHLQKNGSELKWAEKMHRLLQSGP